MQSTGTPDSSMYYENMVMIVCTSDAIFDFCSYSTAVVQLTCNEQVVRSNRTGSSKKKRAFLRMLFVCIYLYV